MYTLDYSNIIFWLTIFLPVYFSSLNYWIRYPNHKAIHRRIDQVCCICGYIIRHILMNKEFIDHKYWIYFILTDFICVCSYFISLVYAPSYIHVFAHFMLHIFGNIGNYIMIIACSQHTINYSSK